METEITGRSHTFEFIVLRHDFESILCLMHDDASDTNEIKVLALLNCREIGQ